MAAETQLYYEHMKEKSFSTNSPEETKLLGGKIGKSLRGGETIEFLSDLGGGKTTFVSGLAEGFGSSDPVASPSFTISSVYARPDKKQIHHFDFYRLSEPGIIKNELTEVEGDPDRVVVVEWGDIIHDSLPKNRVVIKIEAVSETKRKLTITYPKELEYLFSA